jgi:hypothetical protein
MSIREVDMASSAESGEMQDQVVERPKVFIQIAVFEDESVCVHAEIYDIEGIAHFHSNLEEMFPVLGPFTDLVDELQEQGRLELRMDDGSIRDGGSPAVYRSVGGKNDA